MKFVPRSIAALVLLGWLFAIVHLAAEHGVGAFSGVEHGFIAHNDHHHDDDPEHHHHDLPVLAAGPVAKAANQDALALVWVALCDSLDGTGSLLQRHSAQPHGGSCFGNAPPDARASGWLLVCRTARPVRGPSLVV